MEPDAMDLQGRFSFLRFGGFQVPCGSISATPGAPGAPMPEAVTLVEEAGPVVLQAGEA